jgi:hypothetical protein
MKNVFIFAVVIATAISPALANAHQGSTWIKHTENKSKLLANGADKSFMIFMASNAKKITKTTEWRDFQDVLTLYNQEPVKFLGVSESQQIKFNEASSKLAQKLNRVKGAEAKIWAEKLATTVSTINYLWKYFAKVEVQMTDTVEDEIVTTPSL